MFNAKVPKSLVIFFASIMASPALHVSPAVGATYKVLYGFTGGSDGGGLFSGVVIDSKGDLLGGTVSGGNGGGGTIYEIQSLGDGKWSKVIIHDLDFHNDGGNLSNGMVFDPAGRLYGTTESGGPEQFGTVFQLVPSPGGQWTLNVLYDLGSFTGLAIDPSGNLYGLGAGAFELSPSPDGWTYKQIYDFSGKNDGGVFYSPMILDRSGNLYGTTFGGGHGNFCAGGGGCGTVFKLHPNADGTWTEHLLHRFAATPHDGQYVYGGLVRDAAGNLYGTTLKGGYAGTIFKLSHKPDGGWKETILYDFPHARHNGGGPAAGLVSDGAGNLYGTTSGGGDPQCACGVIFKLAHNPDDTWTYSVLHRFHGTDGSSPQAPLVMDKQGNFYGTTTVGGPGGYGVVFKVTQ